MNQTMATGFGGVNGSPTNGGDYGNYGNGPGAPSGVYPGMVTGGHPNRNAQNNFFLPPGSKYSGSVNSR